MEAFENSLRLGESGEDEQSALLNEFLKVYGDQSLPKEDSNGVEQNFKVVEPVPQMCIKSKANDGSKVFLNICTADHIPNPKDITEDELIKLIESEDPSQYRVPMSLGEPHVEVDKSGNGCTAYDIVISLKFCEKIKANETFMIFFMMIIMEGIDNKYNVTLSRDWIKLKNKKHMGKIQRQHIRTSSKPWIQEVDETLQ